MAEEVKEEQAVEKGFKLPQPDKEYFVGFWQRCQGFAQGSEISPHRLKEMIKAVETFPDANLGLKEVKAITDLRLTPTETGLFVSLRQMRREINEAVEEGSLSWEEAEKLISEFGFSKESDKEARK